MPKSVSRSPRVAAGLFGRVSRGSLHARSEACGPSIRALNRWALLGTNGSRLAQAIFSQTRSLGTSIRASGLQERYEDAVRQEQAACGELPVSVALLEQSLVAQVMDVREHR